MRRSILFLILAFTILTNQGIAQPAEQTKSLLWKISGNGLTKPSYLFGTIHLICSADYFWTDKMKESLAAADKVCFEMDLDDNAVMMAASAGFMDTTGKKLKDYFTPADYQKLKKFVKDSIGMDISIFQSMKPIALESMMQMKVTNCMDATSYEERIMRTALADHKEVMGLEDPSEQIGALESMPADSVVKEMMDGIAGFTQNKKEYADMIAAYRRQELPLLYELITSSKGLGDNMAMFLDDRNKRWISRMAGKMTQHSVFFAVGAGHLPGNNGVISLLRRAGYVVTPVL